MKTVLVGVGQAGGKVATALAEYDDEMGFRAIRDALAINSAKADLQGLPLDTVLIGQDVVKGHGVGGDNQLGAEVMQNDADEVLNELSGRIDSETEAIFIVAGLGGGTGSGGAPVLAKELERIYDVPVYAIGILPGRDEGSLYQANAGRSLKTLAREADSTILIDNDAWRETGDSVAEGMATINERIARRIGLLLAAGEPIEDRSMGLGGGGIDRDVGQSVVDTSEVINTLRGGGLAAVGYASSEASEDPDDNVNVVTSTTRQALLTGTSLPEATTADAALLVAAGRPDSLSRKGVERARSWVEEETGSMEVRGGDFPLDTDDISALVLLSGVEGSPRVTAFMNRAAEAQAETDDQSEGAAKRDAAESFQNDELDDLL
ncbi:tubulin/FtsZ family protein [Halolamina salifodinae]|uniref:Tubulin-like protein CetZ n=1 Tax=Halolamina salifodinae TaxID=1202767 RepID=A0A8T4GRV7_9EURY|nr:tubulin/FtsZ family protein [Halolamina salifodinae]MBP1985579.1 cell division GTPase FtsZ [Halolamina salifodinae]